MTATRIGTRGSTLALWQANHVKGLLEASGEIHAEIIIIKTSGDRDQESAIGEIGTKGVFIKELEEALLDKRIDLAVHSMKDVPTEIPEGLTIAAILKRDEVRDCLVCKFGHKLAKLPRSAKVGTSSLRRRAQLLRLRPDLDIRELRGNVDTRLRKVGDGEYDAIVLAKAGLDRLGLSQRISEIFAPEAFMPAVGQGAIAVETRLGDNETGDLLAKLDDQETRAAIITERALLAALQGGCQVPIGAWARIERGEMVLEACVTSVDGQQHVKQRLKGASDQGPQLGEQMARLLMETGAQTILEEVG